MGKVEGHEPLHNVDHYILRPSMEPFGTTNQEPNGTKFLTDLIGSKDMIPNRIQRWQTFGTSQNCLKWDQKVGPLSKDGPFPFLFFSLSISSTRQFSS